MPETLPSSILGVINVASLFKIGLIAFLVLYSLFAFFIIRQSVLMSLVLHTKFSGNFKKVAYGHLIASLLVLIIVLVLVS